MSENKEFEGTVGTDFEGNTIKPALTFKYNATVYANYDEVPADEKLSAKEMTQAVNAANKAAARAKATTKALNDAGYKKPDANDPSVVRANMIKLTMKLYNLDEATATKIVEASAASVAALQA